MYNILIFEKSYKLQTCSSDLEEGGVWHDIVPREGDLHIASEAGHTLVELDEQGLSIALGGSLSLQQAEVV